MPPVRDNDIFAPSEATHTSQVAAGERFRFGYNWRQFLHLYSMERLAAARQSLCDAFQRENFNGLSFLDAGCGSGLFSLAAATLGARVVSFDFDPQSVACAEFLRTQPAHADYAWHVQRGSLLDAAYIAELGQFDLVYCWGVAHHTGQMWTALHNLMQTVRSDGQICVALYNDQGMLSRLWALEKRLYNRSALARSAAIALYYPYLLAGRTLLLTLGRRSRMRLRGMDLWHDMLDWLGGHPFEVASRVAMHEFFMHHGFLLEFEISVGKGQGCNQATFRKIVCNRESDAAPPPA